MSERRCKVCGNIDKYLESGIFNNKSRKRYVNEQGKQWNGLVCPTCHTNRTKVRMRMLRNSRDNEEIN